MSDELNTGLWSVLDKNAKGKPRIHETPRGKQYALQASEPTFMPKADALIFLRDPAFVVMDESGAVQAALPSSEAAGDRKVRELAANECVARYEELSTSALLARVATRPGGASIDTTAPRDVLIAFLERAPTRQDERPENRIRDTGSEDDTIDRGNAAMRGLPSLDEQLREVAVIQASRGGGASAGFGA